MHKCIIVNVPTFFYILWKIIKLLMTKNTTDKIELLKDDGLQLLKNEMNIRDLPVCMGGKNKEKLSLFSGPWKDAFHQSFK